MFKPYQQPPQAASSLELLAPNVFAQRKEADQAILTHALTRHPKQRWSLLGLLRNPFAKQKATWDEAEKAFQQAQEQEKQNQSLQGQFKTFAEQFFYPRLAQAATEKVSSTAVGVGLDFSSIPLPDFITNGFVASVGWAAGLVARAVTLSYLQQNPSLLQQTQHHQAILKQLFKDHEAEINTLTQQFLTFLFYIKLNPKITDKEFKEELQKIFNSIVAVSYSVKDKSITDSVLANIGLKNPLRPFNREQFQRDMLQLFGTMCQCAIAQPQPVAHSFLGVLWQAFTGFFRKIKNLWAHFRHGYSAAQRDTLASVIDVIKDEGLQQQLSNAATASAVNITTPAYLHAIELLTKHELFLGHPDFWLQEFDAYTGNNPELEKKLQEKIRAAKNKSEVQYQAFCDRPEVAINKTKAFIQQLHLNGEDTQTIKAILKRQILFLLTQQLNKDAINHTQLQVISAFYVNDLGGNASDNHYLAQAYHQIQQQREQEEKARFNKQKSERANFYAIQAGSTLPSSLGSIDLPNPQAIKAEATLNAIDGSIQRATARAHAHAANAFANSPVAHSIHGAIYGAIEAGFTHLSELLGAENQVRLDNTGNEFEPSTYARIKHLVETDLLERTTQWVTQHYLLHETNLLKKSWIDHIPGLGTLTSAAKEGMSSVISQLSSAIVGEIFYRFFPVSNQLNTEQQQLVQQARKEFCEQHLATLNLISTEMLRLMVFIEKNPDPLQSAQQMRAILSQLDNAINTLASTPTTYTAWEALKSIFSTSDAAAPAQIRSALYQLCGKICDANISAVRDNPISQAMAAEEAKKTTSIVGVAEDAVIGTVSMLGGILGLGSPIHAQDKPRQDVLLHLKQHFLAVEQATVLDDLYRTTTQANQPYLAALESLPAGGLSATPNAWLVDYRVRSTANGDEATHQDHRAEIAARIQAANDQQQQFLTSPHDILAALEETEAFLNDNPNAVAQLGLKPLWRMQIIALVDTLQSHLFGLPEGNQRNTYASSVAEALGAMQSFYVECLDGEITDIENAADLRLSFSELAKQCEKLQSSLGSQKNLLLGSPVLWLFYQRDYQFIPNQGFSHAQPELTADNIDKFIFNTLAAIHNLAQHDQTQFSLYRLFLLKQLAELITPDSANYLADPVARVKLKTQLLPLLSNKPLSDVELAHIAYLQFAEGDFLQHMRQLLALAPAMLHLYRLADTKPDARKTLDQQRNQVAHDFSETRKKAAAEKLAKKAQALEKKQSENKSIVAELSAWQHERTVEQTLQQLARNRDQQLAFGVKQDLQTLPLAITHSMRASVLSASSYLASELDKPVRAFFGLDEPKPISLNECLTALEEQQHKTFADQLKKSAETWAIQFAAGKVASWFASDYSKPLLEKIARFYVPSTAQAVGGNEVAASIGSEITGYFAGLLAQNVVGYLLENHDALTEQQQQALHAGIDPLLQSLQSSIQPIANMMLGILAYIQQQPQGLSDQEMANLLSQLDSAIANLANSMTYDETLKERITKLFGHAKASPSPISLQRKLYQLCGQLCQNAICARSQSLIGSAMHAATTRRHSLIGTAAHVAATVIDSAVEFTTNQSLLAQYNSLERRTLTTFRDQLQFKANTVSNRQRQQTIFDVDKQYLDSLESMIDHALFGDANHLLGTPQAWLLNYREHAAKNSDHVIHNKIKELVINSAWQTQTMIENPSELSALLKKTRHYINTNRALSPHYHAMLREQLLLIARGIAERALRANDEYSKQAVQALVELKQHYVEYYGGDADDIAVALSLSNSKAQLIITLLKLEERLQPETHCLMGSSALWLSASAFLKQTVADKLLHTNQAIHPQALAAYLNNTQRLLVNLQHEDPAVYQLYYLFVIKQVCEIATQQLDAYSQFAVAKFIHDLNIDVESIADLATMQGIDFDFQAELATLISLTQTPTTHLIIPSILATQVAAVKPQPAAAAKHENNAQQPEAKVDAWPPLTVQELAKLKARNSQHLTQGIVEAVIQQQPLQDQLTAIARGFFASVNDAIDAAASLDQEPAAAISDYDDHFAPSNWAKLKEYLAGQIGKDATNMLLTHVWDSAQPYIPGAQIPGVGIAMKCGGLLLVNLISIVTGKAFEQAFKAQSPQQEAINKIIAENQDEIINIAALAKEMTRLLVYMQNSEFDQQKAWDYLHGIMQKSASLVPQEKLASVFTLFEKITELAADSFADNPIASYFHIHHYDGSQRACLHAMSQSLKAAAQAAKKYVAAIPENQQYNDAVAELLKQENILVGKDDCWAADYLALGIPNEQMQQILLSSQTQLQDLIANPQKIPAVINTTRKFLAENSGLASTLALPTKIKAQLLSLGVALIQKNPKATELASVKAYYHALGGDVAIIDSMQYFQALDLQQVQHALTQAQQNFGDEVAMGSSAMRMYLTPGQVASSLAIEDFLKLIDDSLRFIDYLRQQGGKGNIALAKFYQVMLIQQLAEHYFKGNNQDQKIRILKVLDRLGLHDHRNIHHIANVFQLQLLPQALASLQLLTGVTVNPKALSAAPQQAAEPQQVQTRARSMSVSGSRQTLFGKPQQQQQQQQIAAQQPDPHHIRRNSM